jgi:hypothetical protein
LQYNLECSWDGRYIEARENSNVVAWGNSNVVAWENSNVVAWGNSFVRALSSKIRLVMNGFSILTIDSSLALKFKKTKTVLVQKHINTPYLEREGIKTVRGYVILFKKVSHDFKTQEKSINVTSWTIGSVVTHKKWNAEKENIMHALALIFVMNSETREMIDILQ